MHVPIPILAAIGVAFLVLVLIAFARRSRGHDLMGPPRSSLQDSARPSRSTSPAPATTDLPPALELEVRALLQRGEKLEAIKRVREVTRAGLAEAKAMVERL